jgi:hypothetical protein
MGEFDASRIRSTGQPPVAAPPPANGTPARAPAAEPEDEEEEGRYAGAAPQTEAYVPPPPMPEPRVRTEAKHNTGIGTAAVIEGKHKWVATDADHLWAEMIQYLNAIHRSPQELSITVTRYDEQSNRVGWIDAGSVLGGPTVGPAETLFNALQRIHLSSGVQTPMLYRARFCWKRTGTVFGTGSLQFPAPSEIMTSRQVRMMAEAASPPPGLGYYPQPGAYAPPSPQQPPPQAAPQQPAPPPPPYYPYPYPPPPTGTGTDPLILQELAYLRGQMDETRRANAEGRPPNILPQPAPPPAPPAGVGGLTEGDLTNIVTRVVSALGGPRPAAPPPLPPPPPPPTPSGLTGIGSTLEQAISASLSRVVQTAIQRAEKQMVSSVIGAAGLGAPPADDGDGDDPEPTPEVVPQVEPRELLPFEAIELKQKWGNGSPVVYAKDLDSGQPTFMGTNVMGVALTNPFLLEKLSEGVNALMVTGAEALKRATTSSIGARPQPQQPPPGMGAPPQPQPQQLPPQVPPPVPPPTQPQVAASDAESVRRAASGAWEA